MNRLSAWLVILSLLAVIFGAPVYEVMGGNWPTAGMTGDVTVESVLTGGAAKEVEEALEENALLSKSARPPYNELMYLTLGVVSPRVLLGKDNWLFLASRIGDRPQAAMNRLSQTCEEIAALIRWFEANGTHVIFEFIPRKQSLYPEQLPDNLNPPYEPVYPELVAAMQAAGLDVLDLTDELGPADGVFFLTNDDHWNHEGSRRSAEAVAARIAELYPDGDIPGTPVDAELRTTETYRFAGNLVDMLGFRPDGFLYDRFSVDRARIRAFPPGSPRPALGTEEAQPITVVGTSFSAGFHTASLLVGLLGREVEDRTKAGLAGGYRMADLCRELLLGQRDFPEILVWEFPEDFLVQTVPYFVQPLNSVTEIADGFPYTNQPLPVAERLIRGIRVTKEDETGLSGTVITPGSEIVYRLERPLPGDGSAVLAFPLLVSGRGDQLTRWDTTGEPGSGGTRETMLNNSQYPHYIIVSLKTADGKPVRRIRITPFDRFARFHMGPPELWTR